MDCHTRYWSRDPRALPRPGRTASSSARSAQLAYPAGRTEGLLLPTGLLVQAAEGDRTSPSPFIVSVSSPRMATASDDGVDFCLVLKARVLPRRLVVARDHIYRHGAHAARARPCAARQRVRFTCASEPTPLGSPILWRLVAGEREMRRRDDERQSQGRQWTRRKGAN